jgi:hypothetical protein
MASCIFPHAVSSAIGFRIGRGFILQILHIVLFESSKQFSFEDYRVLAGEGARLEMATPFPTIILFVA